MEVALLCCVDERAAKFAHVVEAMESDDGVLAALAMRLVARASGKQIQGAEKFFAGAAAQHHEHQAGLSLLLNADHLPPEVVSRMLDSENPLERKYAAVAVGRSFRGTPALVDKVASSNDLHVRGFAKEVGRPTGPASA